MRRKKSNLKTYIIIVLLALIVLGLVGYFIFLKDDDGYNYQEKKWIADNSNKILDIYVNNELPIFSYSSEGVFYDFVNSVSEDTGLKFNTVTTNAKYKLTLSDTLKENDIVFYTDHFIVISENDKLEINSINDLANKKIGVLSSNANSIKYYLTNVSGINYISYETFDNIEASLNDMVDLAIVPRFNSINKLISQNYKVLYHLNDLNIYYVFTSEENNELNNIFNKFFKTFNKTLTKLVGENIMEIYYNASNISQINRESLNSKDYIVGYVENLPYEGSVRTRFTGITDSYLEEFTKISGITFKYNQYRNIESLNESLSSNDIDLLYNYRNYESTSYVKSAKLNRINYVVLAHKSNDLVLNSVYGLKGYNVKMLKDNILTTYFRDKDIFSINEVSDAKSIVKRLNKNDIIILEKEVYDFYKEKLINYSIRYSGMIKESNSFLLYNGNTLFNDVFNFYLNIVSPEEINTKAVNNTIKDVKGPIYLEFIVKFRAYFICGILIGIYALYKFISIKKRENRLKKEDKLIYRDKLTNLKNRNYLNDNIDLWDSNKVYPQAVILIDLKNIQYINDTAGHEEGDRQIQAAANILIKNQRENSEIIRTDGNEFLLYLVGYEEKVITAYMNKLNKELKKLPYTYGASIGYSMITSDIKSVDDAINDAITMMKQSKEDNSEK